jgi:DNA-binding response OmpR family regulator
MSASILVVEDEAPIREGLVDRFGREGFLAAGAPDVAAAEGRLADSPCDLIVLDLMLPGVPGEELLRRLRDRGDRTPVLVLSARGREPDRVLLLALGADDYVVKPFSVRELVERVRAILRRAVPARAAGTFSVGDAVVDLSRYRIHRDGRDYPITATERGMLHLLVERNEAPVSREDFLRTVWGYDRVPETRTVDFHVVRLRRKLEPDPKRPRHLMTVHGAGYRLVGVSHADLTEPSAE